MRSSLLLALFFCFSGLACSGGTTTPPVDKQPDAGVNLCDPNPCSEANRSVCVAENNAARCDCDEGFVLSNGACVSTGPCAPNPCTESGRTVCTPDGASFTCACDEDRMEVNGACELRVCAASGAGPVITASTESAGTYNTFANAVWTGTEVAVAWSDARGQSFSDQTEIYFARFSPEGSPLGETRVTNKAGESSLGAGGLAWNGTHFGLAWLDTRDGGARREVYFRRLAADGSAAGAEQRLTIDAVETYDLSVAAVGQGWAVAWYDSNVGVQLRLLSADGTPTGPAFKVNTTGQLSGKPRLTSRGDSVGIAWLENAAQSGLVWRLRLRVYSAAGTEIGETIDVADNADAAGFVWTGSAWAFAVPTGEPLSTLRSLMLHVIAPDGSRLVDGVALVPAGTSTQVFGVHLRASPTELAATWRDGATSLNHFVRIGPDGEMRGSIEELPQTKGSAWATLAWGGERWFAFWHDFETLPPRYTLRFRTFCP